MTPYERIVENGRLLGFLMDQGYHGWFVQLPGAQAWTAPRWGCTRDEAIAYLREQVP